MELSRQPGPVPDPFFDVVRRRHPDVDIVLLPPEPPPLPVTADAVATDRTVERARDRCQGLAAALWQVLVEDPEQPPTADLVPGVATGWVKPRVQEVRHGTGGRLVLVRLEDELRARGWRVDRVPGPIERVLAGEGEAAVAASYAGATGTFLFELTGPEVYVGSGRARALVGRT